MTDERVWRTGPLVTPALRIYGVPEPTPTNILVGVLITGNWGFSIGSVDPVEVGDQAVEEFLAFINRVNESRERG